MCRLMVKKLSVFFIMVSAFFSCIACAAVTLESSTKNSSSIKIPLSEIYFKEAAASGSMSGFTADKLESVSGVIKTKVVDYSYGYSAAQKWREFSVTLIASGYEILFSCSALECGKKDGYRLFFSKRLNDSTVSQHYVVAKRDNTYKALYIAEIDRQPRAYFLEVQHQPAEKKQQNIVEFKLGSSSLEAGEIVKIDNWLITLKTNVNKISIFGNADAEGSLEVNAELAAKRAEAIKAYMLKKYPSFSEKIVVFSAANLARPLSDERGRYAELSAHYE